MSWDFTKLAQRIPLPKELQEHLFRFLPIPVNPYVPVKNGFEAQMLRDAAGLANEADESASTIYLRLGSGKEKVYTSTLLIKRYPKHVRFGHFRNLAFGGMNPDGSLAIHSVRYTVEIHPIVKSMASKANEHKLNRLRHEIEEAIGNHQIPDSDLVKAHESLEAIIKEVEYTDNLPFEIWVYITTWATSVEKLKRNIKEITDHLTDKTKINPLYFEQIQGFQAGLTLGMAPNELHKEYPGRFVTSDPLTYLTPFVNGSVSDGTGIYFGNSIRNNSYIFLNLLKGQDGKNIAILGTTGSGKSAAQKALGQSLMEYGFRVIYFDFNGEFYSWCMENGGAYLDQRTQTGKYIEPMMIYPQVSELDTNPIDAMIARVMRTVSILADTLEEYYMVPCDQAIAKVLADHEIDREKPETWVGKSLRLTTDWYPALCEIHTPSAQDLRTRIQRYFEGGQSHLFGKSEPLNLDSQMIVIRLSNPEEADEDPRASLVKMTLALDTVSEKIKRDKLLGEWYTAVFLDELQRSIRNPAIEKFLNTWATSIRHQNGLVVTGTNQASVYLGENAPAQSIWSNSYIKLIFYIEDKEIEMLKKSKAVPDPVIEAIQKSYGQHTFMLKVADRNWEQARFALSPLELKLYATRGLKKDKTTAV